MDTLQQQDSPALCYSHSTASIPTPTDQRSRVLRLRSTAPRIQPRTTTTTTVGATAVTNNLPRLAVVQRELVLAATYRVVAQVAGGREARSVALHVRSFGPLRTTLACRRHTRMRQHSETARASTIRPSTSQELSPNSSTSSARPAHTNRKPKPSLMNNAPGSVSQVEGRAITTARRVETHPEGGSPMRPLAPEGAPKAWSRA
jgi:hypothetical protein